MDETDGPGGWTLGVHQDPRPFELFVRDALRLDVRDEPASPPLLGPPPPDHRDLLTAAERDRVADQWPAWWRAALTHEARTRGTRVRGDVRAWLREEAARREAAVGEPPDFAALSGSPELRRACALLEPELRLWSRNEPARESSLAALEALDCGAIAAEVAARWDAELQQVHGVVLAYGVAGPWRRLVAPGVLACSVVDLETEPHAVVGAVLESSVRLL